MIREVYNDTDDHRRIESETDGDVVRVGKDLDDDLCIETVFDEFVDFTERLRQTDERAFRFRLSNSDSLNQKYTASHDGYGRWYFWRGWKHVLTVNSHDNVMGQFLDIISEARELRDDFDHEKRTRVFVESLYPHREIVSLERIGQRPLVEVVVGHGMQFVDPSTFEKFKDLEAVSSPSVQYDAGESYLKFTVNTDVLREEESDD